MHPYANAISLAQNLHQKYNIRIAAVEVILCLVENLTIIQRLTSDIVLINSDITILICAAIHLKVYADRCHFSKYLDALVYVDIMKLFAFNPLLSIRIERAGQVGVLRQMEQLYCIKTPGAGFNQGSMVKIWLVL